MVNIGLHSGLVDSKHCKAMGSSVWLYLWFLHRQTKASGLVLGGMPLTYAEISRRSGFAERKVRYWMDNLRDKGYVAVGYRNYKMMAVTVLNPKKFSYKQLPLTENGQSIVPKTVNGYTKNCQSKQSVSMKYIESSSKHTSAASPPARDLPGFALFWEAYPNKFDQDGALRQWLSKVRIDADWLPVLEGLDRWKICSRWSNPRYIPNPANFLFRMQWLEDPPKENTNGRPNETRRSPAALPSEPGRKYKEPVRLSTIDTDKPK